MNERLQIKDVRNADVTGLAEVIQEWNPSVIAIDSPPEFGVEGNSRLAERELNRRGIKIFYTPSDAEKSRRPFYTWMEVGHKCFKVASKCGFELFNGTGSVEGRAIEVIPHASAVVLTGSRPPRGWQKRKSDKGRGQTFISRLSFQIVMTSTRDAFLFPTSKIAGSRRRRMFTMHSIGVRRRLMRTERARLDPCLL